MRSNSICNLSEIIEQPVTESHIFRWKIPGSLGRVNIDSLQFFSGRRRRKRPRPAASGSAVANRLSGRDGGERRVKVAVDEEWGFGKGESENDTESEWWRWENERFQTKIEARLEDKEWWRLRSHGGRRWSEAAKWRLVVLYSQKWIYGLFFFF